jgi:hypothetical protein
MQVVAIDLSIRSTGLHFTNGEINIFRLITPSPNEYKDEDVLPYVAFEIVRFICDMRDKYGAPDEIHLEGLSYNSVSGSKDFIAGNFWYTRVALKDNFPNIPVKIIAVTEWREPYFNTEERRVMREATKKLKEFKVSVKGLKGEERTNAILFNEKLIEASSIKYQTYLKLPEIIKLQIDNMHVKDGKYDLTDAYFLARHGVTF